MKLSDEWFTALSQNDNGQLITVSGRDELTEFVNSGKYNERAEVTWKYDGDEKGMPPESIAKQIEAVEEALRHAITQNYNRFHLMFAIEIISAKTPAAVTSAPAP